MIASPRRHRLLQLCPAPHPVSVLVDLERREPFREEGTHFQSACYLTLLWMPQTYEAAGEHENPSGGMS